MFRFLEHRIPPPIIGMITLLAIWLIARYGPGPVFKHSIVTIIAILLLVCGLVFDLVSLGAFRKARTTFNPLSPNKASALVTGGLYRVSRNPMYLGMLLILTAWFLYQGHWAGIFALIAFVLYMNRFQIRPEEDAMIENFGQDYLDYMQQVRRWI